MTNKIEELDKILSNKRKFRRLLLLIIIIALVICYGFYSDAINVHIEKVFSSPPQGAIK
jgi:hypothetical protein